nr:MAG TPA: hypothetical protein [Caudoviricetes sp.]
MAGAQHQKNYIKKYYMMLKLVNIKYKIIGLI